MLTKLEKYREGLYLMSVPPVSTHLWTEQDWIDFININGSWLGELL